MLWVKLYRSPAVENAVTSPADALHRAGWPQNRATGPITNSRCLFYAPEDAVAARLAVKQCWIDAAATSCPQEHFGTLFSGFVA